MMASQEERYGINFFWKCFFFSVLCVFYNYKSSKKWGRVLVQLGTYLRIYDSKYFAVKKTTSCNCSLMDKKINERILLMYYFVYSQGLKGNVGRRGEEVGYTWVQIIRVKPFVFGFYLFRHFNIHVFKLWWTLASFVYVCISWTIILKLGNLGVRQNICLKTLKDLWEKNDRIVHFLKISL